MHTGDQTVRKKNPMYNIPKKQFQLVTFQKTN